MKQTLHSSPKTDAVNYYLSVTGFTKISFKKYPDHKKDFGLKKLSNKKAMKALSKQIKDVMRTYGIDRYKGISLYDIDSSYALSKAFILIKNGVIDNTDFNTGKEISNVVSRNTYSLSYDDMFFKEAEKDIHLQNKARNAADSYEDYTDKLYDFMAYKADVLRNKYYTGYIKIIIENLALTGTWVLICMILMTSVY